VRTFLTGNVQQGAEADRGPVGPLPLRSALADKGRGKMELDEAKSLLSALANGIDPITGEVLLDTSPYNEPRVIRALFTVLNPAREVSSRKRLLTKSSKKMSPPVAHGIPDCLGRKA